MVAMDTLIQWLHLMAAMTWVGGLLAMSLVVQPAMQENQDSDVRIKLYRKMGRRFFYVKWGSWSVLASTGAFKLWEIRKTPAVFMSHWGMILAVKLFLVAVMVVLCQLHSCYWTPQLAKLAAGHPRRKMILARMSFWGKVNLAVIAAIVFCAAAMRMNSF